MNQKIIKNYITAYKDQFEKISQKELYKWKAVKQFQDHWDIDAVDFSEMLKESLKKVTNLMDAGRYFPKRMLVKNSLINPEEIRQLFYDLFNEEEDLNRRILNFQKDFQIINTKNFGEDNPYQDQRAVVVYLTLRYPERYYFYKFGMFKGFTDKVDYVYKPIGGRIENVPQFQNLCETIKYLITQDQELLRLHKARLTDDCYIDEHHNILTQDFIYAVVQHLDVKANSESEDFANIAIQTMATSAINVTTTNVSFNGSITNHIQNNKENKRIGDLGELFVIDYEKEKLIQANKPKLAKKVAHHAKDKGDGLGYDVLSFDVEGNKMFIEVKATKSNKNTPFFITRNELERSKLEKDKFFIYRVYHFNDENLRGDVLILQGDASNLCVEAVNYKVKMQ